MKKQNWKKNKKSTASLRKILFMLSKDLPSLADDLIGTWEGAANFANDVAESIIQSKPLRVPLNTGRCEDFQKYEVLGERGWVYLLPPYDFDMLAYHSPLMAHCRSSRATTIRGITVRKRPWKTSGKPFSTFPRAYIIDAAMKYVDAGYGGRARPPGAPQSKPSENTL